MISIFDEEAETELPRAYVVPAREDDHARCEAASKADTNLTSLAQHVKSWTEERTANYKWYAGHAGEAVITTDTIQAQRKCRLCAADTQVAGRKDLAPATEGHKRGSGRDIP